MAKSEKPAPAAEETEQHQEPKEEAAEQTEKQKPTEIRVGRAMVKIWSNPGPDGKTWKNATMSCLFKPEGDDQKWKESYSFGTRDVAQLIEALQEANRQMGGLGEEESKDWKPIVTRSNADGQPDVVKVGNTLVKIWVNSNGEKSWKNATTASLYQKDGKTMEGHSFARRETAQLAMGLQEAQKLMGGVEGTAATTNEKVSQVTEDEPF